MTSEFSSCSLSIALSVESSLKSSFFQTPLVSGCDGFALRAQTQTFASNCSATSALFGSSVDLYCPFSLSGSFIKSQITTRRSSPNRPTTALTYGSISVDQLAGFFRIAAPGACTQPELCVWGFGARCLPICGFGSHTESSSTNMMRMWCLSATPKNLSIRSRKPAGSCFHARLCRNTRIVFMPMFCAQPSSRSIVGKSNVSACHISSSLIAVDGMKLLPTSHGCASYQSLARFIDQRSFAEYSGAVDSAEVANGTATRKRKISPAASERNRIPDAPWLFAEGKRGLARDVGHASFS